MTKQLRRTIVFITSIYIILITFNFVVSISKPDIVLFPNNAYKWISFSEKKDKNFINNSTHLQLYSHPKEISLGGITRFNCLDISKFHKFEIAIDSTTASEITFYIGVNCTNIDLDTHQVILSSTVTIQPNKKSTIDIKDMKIPLWWYNKHSLHPKKRIIVNNKTCTIIGISPNYISPQIKPEYIHIKNISLKQNRILTTVVYLSTLALPFLFILVFKLLTTLWNKFSKHRVVSQTRSSKGQNNPEYGQLISLIAKDFSSPELSLNFVANKLGVSPEIIEKMLKEEFQKTFFEYVNSIRITEATRLLKTTDWQIKEIAYLVGFKHVTSFNKIFKEINGSSPKEYR